MTGRKYEITYIANKTIEKTVVIAKSAKEAINEVESKLKQHRMNFIIYGANEIK